MDKVDSQVTPLHPVPGEAARNGVWRASPLALFLPALVVATGYGALLVALVLLGRGEGPLARICVLVITIVVPLLLAYAGLRFSTTRMTLRPAHLEVHPGFPARDPVLIAYPAITRVALRRGLSGWITGAGSLVIERDDGAPVIVSGLSGPDAALSELAAHRDAVRPSEVTDG